MKTIKGIAKDAGFDCKIERHGVYTNYMLTKGTRIIRIEYANSKHLRKGYTFMANGHINHDIENAGNFVFGIPYHGTTHALANGFGGWYYLNIEQVENLVKNNQ